MHSNGAPVRVWVGGGACGRGAETFVLFSGACFGIFPSVSLYNNRH